MTVLFLGDSHLAYVTGDRLKQLEAQLGTRVVNGAVGGCCVTDLAWQAAGRDLPAYDAVVLSIGTNDAFAPTRVELPEFERVLAWFTAAHQGTSWVLLTPPGVDEQDWHLAGGLSNDRLEEYADRAARVVTAEAGDVVRAREVLSPPGPRVFVGDGVHLTDTAYDRLLPALAAAIAGVGRPSP